MLCYKDKTFCVSPNCQNECGRKLTDEIRALANQQDLFISCAYFCDQPKFDIETIDAVEHLPLD